jgi:hypothetical protein
MQVDHWREMTQVSFRGLYPPLTEEKRIDADLLGIGYPYRHRKLFILQGAVYSVLRKSVAKSRPLENAIDSWKRIKTTTCSDVWQKPYQFYWHGLLHITIGG